MAGPGPLTEADHCWPCTWLEATYDGLDQESELEYAEAQPEPEDDPPEPPLPPINFKYYGFSTVLKDGRKAAFFLQNDIILIKAEGDMVAGTYKLVRIDRTTAVVEDVKSKRRQTVVLAEEAEKV